MCLPRCTSEALDGTTFGRNSGLKFSTTAINLEGSRVSFSGNGKKYFFRQCVGDGILKLTHIDTKRSGCAA